MRAVGQIITRRGECDTLGDRKKRSPWTSSRSFLDHGSQTLAAFKDNIPTLLAIIAISAKL